jgi:alpha-amylase
MPKLDFEKPHVIEVLRKYAKYLLSLGVDGFRIDAAKHLSVNGLRKILEGLTTAQGVKPFIYQEYFIGSPEGVDVGRYMEKYFKLGPVTCFNYGIFLADVFLKRGGNTLQSLVEYSFGTAWVQYPDQKAVVLIDNHDTERYLSNMLNFKNNVNNSYMLAYVFMLAWPFGIPKVNSSVMFSGIDDPIPDTPVWENGQSDNYKPGFPWICQHRWKAIANMVLFRRKSKGAKGVTNVWLNGDQVAFSRTTQRLGEAVYSVAFIVINNSDRVLEKRFETGLPRGIYADLIKCELEHGKMIGPKIEVEDYGFSTITVPPYDAIALCMSYSELF